MSTINLFKNKIEILNAWRDVVDDKTPTNWAIFGYEGLSDVLSVVSKGNDGIDEMKDELNSGMIMYAFCKVFDPKTNLNKFILINWQGEGTPLLRKGVCANHIRDVSNLLKGAHVTLNARTEEDVDSDVIIDKVSNATASSYSFEERLDLSKDGFMKLDPVYRKVIPENEINAVEREKFWAYEEELEKKRQMEEIKKKKEELLRLEEERLKREIEEAKKRELPEPNHFISDSKKVVVEPLVSINSKIEQIEKAKNSTELLKEQRSKEAQTLISQKTADVRAVFEQHTSVGQLKTSRKLSAQFNEPLKINSDGNSSTDVKVNGDILRDSMNPRQNSKQKITPENRAPNAEIKDYQKEDEESPNNVGLRAVALYDYSATDETEISFDPDDIITHIEQIDPGWWQGLGPGGNYGLFPANYVQLIQ